MKIDYPDYSDIVGEEYAVQWRDGSICLDGEFTSEDLRAIADRLDKTASDNLTQGADLRKVMGVLNLGRIELDGIL